MWLSTFSTALSSMSGPCVALASRPGAGFSFRTAAASFAGERVVDRVLHEQAVRADAGLAGVAVLRRDRALHRRVQIRIVEHDERRVAAELERQLLHRRRALRHQQLADLGRAGERQLADDRVRRSARRRSRTAEPVMTLKTPFGTPARSASSASASAENGVCDAGFSTTVQPAAIAGPGLARDHRQRKIPRRDAGDDADRLLDDDDALVGLVGGNGVAVDALGFFAEPLEERRGVGDFAARFARAACPARASSAARGPPGSPSSGRTSAAGRRRAPSRSCVATRETRARPRRWRARVSSRPSRGTMPSDLAGRRVVDVDRAARRRLDPRAVDVAGLAETAGDR